MTLRALVLAARRRRRRAKALRLYRRFLAEGDLCFDVGANVGDRTELFLALGARVVAVEPQSACVEALARRFGSRIELVPAALGPRPGEAELLVASYHTLSSLSSEWVAAVQASGRLETGFVDTLGSSVSRFWAKQPRVWAGTRSNSAAWR